MPSDSSDPNTAPPRRCHVAVITVSDRVSRGEYEDLGGPAVERYLRQHFETTTIRRHVIPDDQPLIQRTLTSCCDDDRCDWVITTGGTGPAPRDVTPEATEAVCQKMLPGFGEHMRAVSVASVPTAILSRATAGIRGTSLVLNLPGKPAAVDVCLDAVAPAINGCIKLAGGCPPKRKKRPDHSHDDQSAGGSA